MVKTTRSQREALQRIHQRLKTGDTQPAPSYRAFRRRVQPTFGCDGAVAVPFVGMWLCVERDGYVHS